MAAALAAAPGPHTVSTTANDLLALIRGGALDGYTGKGHLRRGEPVLAELEDAKAALSELLDVLPDVVASATAAIDRGDRLPTGPVPSLAA